MKNYSIVLLLLLFFGCNKTENSVETPFESNLDVNKKFMGHQLKCPQGHADHIIPIVYGHPTEETFAKADSGLVMLGGCEVGEHYNWCTLHEIEF